MQYLIVSTTMALLIQLMKHALTIVEVHPSTSRFAEQRDTVRELRQSEAAAAQRHHENRKKKFPFMRQ